MSRKVILKAEVNVFNDQKKQKFMIAYENLIDTKVRKLDNGTHNKTSTKRHLERLRDRVAEDMLADIPESGYVTKQQQQQYQS